jgi:hypothetical protein
LSRGRAWSLVGVLCVVVGLAFNVYWVVELPQLGIYGLLTGFLEITGPAADSIGNFNFALANLGAAILVTPFVATSMALHYLDARFVKKASTSLQRCHMTWSSVVSVLATGPAWLTGLAQDLTRRPGG